MPRNPNPIRPRVQDARAYEKALRRTYINPMFGRLRKKLATAEAATQAYHAMDDVVAEMVAQPRSGVPIAEIQKSLNSMEGYHKERVKKTFRAALAVDIGPLLTEPEIAAFMQQKLSDNVDLIKTIPPRMHAGLKRRLERALAEAPFDQNMLFKVFREEYQSTGYNVRRLTRDQTSKTINGLSRIRQTQLGIDHYQWLTSQDSRVRATHQANSGRVFAWASPPAETGNPGDSILCRCNAIPIVTKAQADRLKGAESHSITKVDLETAPLPGQARPGGIKPPGSPPPPPAARPTPTGYVAANKHVRPALEEAWHREAWQGADDTILNAVGNTPPTAEVIYQGKGAWYKQFHHVLNMNGLREKNRRALSTWRHEFGHRMDNALAGDGVGYASSATPAFTKAVRADTAALRPTKKRVGAIAQHPQASRKLHAGLDDDTRKFQVLSDGERRARLDDLAQSTGLDVEEVTKFLSDEGPLGFDGPGRLRGADKDAVVYRVMVAWEKRDLQGVLDVTNFTRHTRDLVSPLRPRHGLTRWMEDNTGTNKHLSDLANAATHDRVSGGFGHSKSYYKNAGYLRNTEIFADTLTVLSSGPFGRKFMLRFFPKTLAESELMLDKAGP